MVSITASSQMWRKIKRRKIRIRKQKDNKEKERKKETTRARQREVKLGNVHKTSFEL
jgi:hypothetical protein